MGSPISSIVADLALIKLESVVIPSFDFDIPLYLIYVDDILILVKPEMIGHIHESFNSFHDRLNFTLESPSDNSINFLDVTLTNQNTHITTN